MKRIIGYIIAWSLYGLGHIISIPLFKYDRLGWLYTPYNWLMGKSYDVKVWAGNATPWSNEDE